MITESWLLDKPQEKKDYVLKAVVEAGGDLELRGKIIIGPQAHGADAFLRLKVLLLGENARAITVPELEIMTNDVKAGHAASVGRLDQEQIFYLMSRGISREEATKLLVEAFLNEVN